MPLDQAAIPGAHNIVRQTYPNGMTVLVKENFSSPSVVIDGLLRAGATDDPIGKEGVSAFTSHLVMRGNLDFFLERIAGETKPAQSRGRALAGIP